MSEEFLNDLAREAYYAAMGNMPPPPINETEFQRAKRSIHEPAPYEEIPEPQKEQLRRVVSAVVQHLRLKGKLRR